MTVLPIPDEEDEPIDPALVVLAARDLHRALKLYDQEGTLVLAGVPDPETGKNPAHEAWIRLGVLLNILPARDLRPAAQRKRAMTDRATRASSSTASSAASTSRR